MGPEMAPKSMQDVVSCRKPKGLGYPCIFGKLQVDPSQNPPCQDLSPGLRPLLHIPKSGAAEAPDFGPRGAPKGQCTCSADLCKHHQKKVHCHGPTRRKKITVITVHISCCPTKRIMIKDNDNI